MQCHNDMPSHVSDLQILEIVTHNTIGEADNRSKLYPISIDLNCLRPSTTVAQLIEVIQQVKQAGLTITYDTKR